MLRRIIIGLAVAGWAGWTAPSYAEWTSLSQGLPEAEILYLTASPKEPAGLYAASSGKVYRRLPDETGWKQVLSVRGTDVRFRFLLADSADPHVIYVASDKGVQKSPDGGKKWNWIYRGMGNKAKAVYFIGEDPNDAGLLWLGTGQGLVRVSKDGHKTEKVASFPETSVHSIWLPREAGAVFLAGTSKGVFKSSDAGAHWEKVFAEEEPAAEESGAEALSQFQIEELGTAAAYSGLVHVPAQNRFLAASSTGVFEAGPEASAWKKISASLPARNIRHLAASYDTFYAATPRGVFQWDPSRELFTDLSEGLPSLDVRSVYFEPSSGDLYAATPKGVYRYPKPEIKIQTLSPEGIPDPGQVLDRFDREPTVSEVQQAAVRYAEVYPEKIEAWRQAAMKKAMLPTLSLTADQGEDHNVDIDRGGTNDPDRFIVGPSETNRDWHLGVSWDLGDLIWNDDQTSIDTRSKLMVELRGDLLNEVTHLYFERRRLQVENILHPAKELPLQIERELKLQELTADIDALTGGFLSARLGEVHDVKVG